MFWVKSIQERTLNNNPKSQINFVPEELFEWPQSASGLSCISGVLDALVTHRQFSPERKEHC